MQLPRRIDPEKLGTERRLSFRVDGATEEIGSRLVQKDNSLSMVGDQDRIGEAVQTRRKPREVEALRAKARRSKTVFPSWCVA
jgi:hypothetical protein